MNDVKCDYIRPYTHHCYIMYVVCLSLSFSFPGYSTVRSPGLRKESVQESNDIIKVAESTSHEIRDSTREHISPNKRNGPK